MKSRIHSVSASGGFLKNCKIEFSPRLNCIIGARGTCKSTLIESIRFTLNCDEAKIAKLIGEEGLIQTTLRDGSFECQTIHTDSSGREVRYTVNRELGRYPREFNDGLLVDEVNSNLPQVEIYSQDDIRQLADSTNRASRIALIDRVNEKEVFEQFRKRQRLVQELAVVGTELRAVRHEITAARAVLKGEPELRERRKTLLAQRPEIPQQLSAEQSAYRRRQEYIELLDLANRELEGLNTAILDVRARMRVLNELRESMQAFSDLSPSEVSTFFNLVPSTDERIAQTTNSLSRATWEGIVASIRKEFEIKDDAYRGLRREAEQAAEYLKQEQILDKELENIEKVRVKNEVNAKREKELLKDRGLLRDKIRTIDFHVHSTRLEEVEVINARHASKVVLSLQTTNSAPEYHKYLLKMLDGSGIKLKDLVVKDIAAALSPFELVEWVETGEAAPLASALGRDLGQINRVLSILAEHPEFYRVEGVPPETSLDIAIFDQGVQKPVESLSSGQKASALLPLILRDLPYPLIIDQPEDDIDNQMISDDLVQSIQALKMNRQLIFVTHNANIPVLGDAEKVIVMRMDGATLAAPAEVGTVEKQKRLILDLLEGGAEAFMEREKRYGSLLLRS